MTCSLQLGVRRLTVPASLVLDESSRWPLTIHLSVRIRRSRRLYILDLLQQPGHCAQLESLVCECYTSNLVRWGVSSVPLCSDIDITVTRYLSPLEQQMVTQVVLGLSNVTYLSMQAVASNELGSFFFTMFQN